MTCRPVINARLADELAAKVEELRLRTGLTLTQIVEAALTAWATHQTRAEPGPASVFAAAGFIGSGRGDPGLARNANAALTRSLKGKA
jgi:hypothetical protein